MYLMHYFVDTEKFNQTNTYILGDDSNQRQSVTTILLTYHTDTQAIIAKLNNPNEIILLRLPSLILLFLHLPIKTNVQYKHRLLLVTCLLYVPYWNFSKVMRYVGNEAEKISFISIILLKLHFVN